MPLNPSDILNNRYRIVKQLGQGGYGAVYRAWDMNLQKSCAVKENLDISPELASQFMREATTLANLVHTNLPRVIDHFSLPGSGQYMVMDFVEGENLEYKVVQNGPISYLQAVSWVGQIADALDYLHHQAQPLIHRDVKPANIIITPTGQAMLVDFGLVKIFEVNTKTAKGARGITPGYSPPEQYGVGKTDARTDIYALGATLYTLISGRVPPQSVDIMAGAEQPPAPLHKVNPLVPVDLSNAVQKAMQMDAAKRYQSATDFKAALFAAIPTMNWGATVQGGAPGSFVQPQQAAGTLGGSRPPSGPAVPGSHPVSTSSRPAGRKGWAIFGVSGCVITAILLVAGVATLWGLYTYTDVLAFLKPPAPTQTSTPTFTLIPFTLTPTHTLTPTPRLEPTEPPVVEPPATEEPSGTVFFDDFSDTTSGWDRVRYSNYITDYEDGFYRIWVNNPNTDVWTNPGLYYSDVIVQVDAIMSGGPTDNDFGVICRYDSRDRYYVALVSSDGYAAIAASYNGNFDILSGEYLERYSAIHQGEIWNRIRFECIGSSLSLYVNEEFIAAVDDRTIASGDVGLLAGTYAEAGTNIYFDNFSVTLP